jgi:lipopolysaccharide assembly outer membrane protein LptD (OstA)
LSGPKAFAAAGEAVIKADEYVKSDLDSNTTIAKKNVQLTNENGQIEAEQLVYNSDSGLVNASGGVKLTTPEGITIQAEQLAYNFNTQEAAFSGGIKLTTQNAVQIKAEQLDYHGNTGLVTASGGVEITTGTGIYQTETIEYNLNDATGSSGPVTITFNTTSSRDFSMVGQSMVIADGITRVIKPKITRCQMPRPEYQYVAKEAAYDGRYMRLKHMILFLKGIPIFYLPVLKLDMTNLNFPDIQPGYNQEDGFFVKYDYSARLSENMSLDFTGLYRSNDYSSLLFGLTTSKDNTSNYTGLYYNTDSEGYGISDRITYNAPLFIASLDGSLDFSANDSTQLGFSVTRKYWKSPLGHWQFGIVGRNVSSIDGSGAEYGGTYGGYRLDYSPFSYFSLSLLRLYSFEGGDYRDFMEEFKLGSNWMYNATIPLPKTYSFSLYGTYNSDQELWIHQIYQINYRTDCLNLSAGWDNASSSWVTAIRIRL